MKFEMICNDVVVNEIAKHCGIKDLCHWAQTNKYFEKRIKKSEKFKWKREIEDKNEPNVKRIEHEYFVKYKLIASEPYTDFLLGIAYGTYYPLLVWSSLKLRYYGIKYKQVLKQLKVALCEEKYIEYVKIYLKQLETQVSQNVYYEFIYSLFIIPIYYQNTKGFKLLLIQFKNAPYFLKHRIYSILIFSIFFDHLSFTLYIYKHFSFYLPPLFTPLYEYSCYYNPQHLEYLLSNYSSLLDFPNLIFRCCQTGDIHGFQRLRHYTTVPNIDCKLHAQLHKQYNIINYIEHL